MPAESGNSAGAVLTRAQELWLRVGVRFEPALTRLQARRTELAGAVALTAFFVFAGGLSLRPWVWLPSPRWWPGGPAAIKRQRASKPRRSHPDPATGCGAW